METTKIQHLDKPTALKLLTNVIEYIGITYAINTPEPKFIAHLLNVLYKHYAYLNFEQIQLAFEYNSLGYLNDYLPHNGLNIDNKVKYTIPDFLKIIKAFVRKKKLDEPIKFERARPSEEKIISIRQQWVNALNEIFIRYRDNYERAAITLPTYTAKVLAGCGYVETTAISLGEPSINVRFGAKRGERTRSTVNEDLIYNAFDRMIAEDTSPLELLKPTNSNELPY